MSAPRNKSGTQPDHKLRRPSQVGKPRGGLLSPARLTYRPNGLRTSMKMPALTRLRTWTWLVPGILFAILTPRPSAHTRSTDVTWTKDIEPIVSARCATCHAPFGSAEPALVSYADARANAQAMREEVLEGRMPPWPAARGLGQFSNDRSL